MGFELQRWAFKPPRAEPPPTRGEYRRAGWRGRLVLTATILGFMACNCLVNYLDSPEDFIAAFTSWERNRDSVLLLAVIAAVGIPSYLLRRYRSASGAVWPGRHQKRWP